MRYLSLFSLLLFVALLGPGCRSTLTGNEGNLSFSYVADDKPLDFNKPIAVGAKLDLSVTEASMPPRLVTLESASTTDPEILGVASFEKSTITVEGRGEGNTLLEVEAEAKEGLLSDSVNLNVRVPEVLSLGHSCGDGEIGHYLVDHIIWVPFDMTMENGQPVIGYGYHPVDIEPAEALTLDTASKDQQWMHFTTAATPQSVTLSSTIDETISTIELHEVTEIDGLELNGDYTTLVDLPGHYFVRPLVGEAPLCQFNLTIEIETLSTDICNVTKPADEWDQDGGENEGGWVKVEGSQIGYCEFSVTLPDANAGQGVSQTFEVEISDVVGPEDGDSSE